MSDVPQTRRPRCLLVAFACSPAQGGEATVGWNRALQAARFCDTTVICQEAKFGDDVRRYFAKHREVKGLRFEFLPFSQWQQTLAKTPGMYWHAYRLWLREARRRAEQMHAVQPFDLTHLVSYCAFREPGDLWKLNVPFIWGPLGGTQNFPLAFVAEAGWRGGAVEVVRNALNFWQLRFRRRVRQAAQRAAAVLAANSTNQRDLQQALGIEAELQLETGLSRVAAQPRPSSPSDRPLRLLWSGQHLEFKGLSLLIRALAQLPSNVAVELQVVGAGRADRSWQKLAQRLGVANRIRWTGWLSHEDALAQYAWADAFVFTSLRDTSGNVMLEALAEGLPVIALDHQGAHDIVSESCGRKIAVVSPRQVVADLQAAIRELASWPHLREKLSAGALLRAESFRWELQGERMAEVYRRVLANNAELSVEDDTQPERERPRPIGARLASVGGQT